MYHCGHFGSSLIDAALCSTKRCVVVGQGGVRPLAGPVVRDEDDHRVVEASGCLQSLHHACQRAVQLPQVLLPEPFHMFLPALHLTHSPGVALGEKGEIEEKRLLMGSLLDHLNGSSPVNPKNLRMLKRSLCTLDLAT